MSTYFKYAERNINEQVDWSKIGKDLTDMLSEQEKLREDKRTAIDEQTRADGLVLADIPQGENEAVNNFALSHGENAQKSMLMMNRLLKKGLLKPKDYQLFSQNLLDGTKNAFSLAKDSQTIYAEGQRRYNAQESAYQEQWQLAQGEAFGNFSKSSLQIDPISGAVSVVWKEPKGSGINGIVKDSEKYTSISALRGRLTEKINKFDTDGNLKKVVDNMGTFLDASGVGKGLKSIEDIKLEPNYKDYQDNIVDQFLVNPVNVGSILTDTKRVDATGKLYDFTPDPEKQKNDKTKNWILLAPDPSGSGKLIPQLTPEQMGDARTSLKNRMDWMLQHKEEAEQKFPPREPNTVDYARENASKDALTKSNMLGKLYYGTDEEIAPAITYFKGLNPNIISMGRDDKGINITYSKDGATRNVTIPFVGANGKIMSQSDFIKSATALSGEADVSSAIKRGGADFNRPFNASGRGKSDDNLVAPPVKGTPIVKSFSGTTITEGSGTSLKAYTASDYFDQEITSRNIFRGEETLAEDYANVSSKILGKLPTSMTLGLQAKMTKDDKGNIFTRIYLPKVMDAPILVHVNGDQKQQMKDILTKIYDIAASGQKVTKDDVFSATSDNTPVTEGSASKF